MKNKLLLGMFVFGGVGIASAQTAQALAKELKAPDALTASSEKYPAIASKALGQVVWHDNFDSLKYGIGLTNTATTNWIVDNSGQTNPGFGWEIGLQQNGWYFPTNWPAPGFPSSSRGKRANLANGTAHPGQGPGNSANNVTYRITSQVIDVASLTGSANAIFSFEQDGLIFNDYQKVQISTNGTTWTDIHNNFGYLPNQTRYGTNQAADFIEIDITPYILSNPNTVQFRFEWGSRFPTNGPGMAWETYGWIVDDVKISTKADYDVAVNSTHYHTEAYRYTQIPTNQIAPIEFQARVSNQGGQDLSGLKLVLDINSGAESAESASPIALPINTLDTLRAIYTPSAVGPYVVAQSVTMDQADDVPANNSNLSNVRFSVTDFIYAVDEASLGVPIARFPEEGYTHPTYGALDFVRFGISFDVFANQTLHGVDFQLFANSTPAQSTEVGAEFAVQLYELTPNAINYVTETDLHIVEASDLNTLMTLPFPAPPALAAGKTYILALTREYSSLRMTYAVAGESETQAYAYCTSVPNNWIRIIDNTPVVRANFQPNAGIKGNAATTTEFSLFPNPATDNATVNFNIANASDVSIEVIDITGKVVKTVSLNNVAAGANSAELNVAGFAAGIYSVAVKTNDSSVTKKLVIK